MKGNSILLTASMLLLTPALIAAEKRSIQFGAEVQGHMITDSWHTKAKSASMHLDTLTSAVTNASGYAYQRSGDQPLNFTFGGRLTAQATISDGFSVLFALGLEEGMGAAKGYRPVDPAGDSAVVTVTEYDAMMTTGVATWKNNVVIAPAVFIGTCPLKVGLQYDLREFVVSGHETAHTAYLDRTLKDAQVLFGFRGEKAFDLGGKDILLTFECMSNLGRASDSDMKTYFENLTKYGFDVIMNDDTTNIMTTGGIFQGAGAVATVASGTRAKVSSVNTLINKMSLGIGFMFNEY